MDGFLSSFLLSMGLLFLSELGDKSQLAIISLSLEDYSTLYLAIGAALGFGAIVTVGGVVASVISQFFPLKWISLCAGVIFLGIGCSQMCTMFQKSKTSTKNIIQDKINFLPNHGAVIGFIAIFLMELEIKPKLR